MTIVEFLLARIAEDEARAQARREAMLNVAERWPTLSEDIRNLIDVRGIDRVLAECQAKRAIVERETAWNAFEPPVGVHVEWSMDAVTAVDGRYVGPDEGRRLMDEWTRPKTDTALLRILAAVYTDHPDYDEAWRP